MAIRTRSTLMSVSTLARPLALGLVVVAFAACGDEAGQVFECSEAGVREAVAAGGGVHVFACDGEIVVGLEDEIVIETDVVLDGEGLLTLDGRDRNRVLRVANSSRVELRGFGIQNGDVDEDSIPANHGGGIYNAGHLTLRDCVVSGNAAIEYGGGIYNANDLTLVNTLVEFNAADEGAGIFSSGASMRIEEGTFTGNVAESGGGAIAINSAGIVGAARASVEISDTLFWSNNAVVGGAMQVDQEANVSVERSVIRGNFADNSGGTGGGGGFYVTGDAEVTVSESTFEGNGAFYGGAVYMGDGTVAVSASTFDTNTGTIGGAVRTATSGAVFHAVNSTFWQNGIGGAGSTGGAIANAGTAYFAHVTFKNNVAASGPSLTNTATLNVRNSYIHGACHLSGGTETFYNAYASQLGICGASNWNDSSIFSDLDDFGGPTETIQLWSGFQKDLLDLDDCTDAFGVPVVTDQRGIERGIDPTGKCDIGAFELEY